MQRRLFTASCLSLVTCGALFAIRSAAADELGVSLSADKALVGAVLGMGFYGMGYVIAVASPLCDLLGMKTLLLLACLLHVLGITGFLFAPGTAEDPALDWARTTMLLVGLAHGLVEGVINPLIATLYPEEKTHKLNVLHAWWPGGIILGGLLAYAMRSMGIGWQVTWGLALVPTLAYGLQVLGVTFPKTERTASGVSAGEMVKASLHPLFLLFVALMAVTAATELGTGSWLDSVLSKTAGFGGVLLLVYGNALMFGLRFFAGPIAHKLSPHRPADRVGRARSAWALAAVERFDDRVEHRGDDRVLRRRLLLLADDARGRFRALPQVRSARHGNARGERLPRLWLLHRKDGRGLSGRRSGGGIRVHDVVARGAHNRVRRAVDRVHDARRLSRRAPRQELSPTRRRVRAPQRAWIPRADRPRCVTAARP